LSLVTLVLVLAVVFLQGWQAAGHVTTSAKLLNAIRDMVEVLAKGMGNVAVLSGGGGAVALQTGKAFLPLSALPAWGQLSGLLPDGQPDPQQFNDCGETCVSMVVASVHGCPVNPGSVRAAVGGPLRSGLTTGDDLVKMLAYYNVSAHLEVPGKAGVQGTLTGIAGAQRPAIVLGTWPTPGGALHWMVSTGVVERWSYINPWGGVHSFLEWDSMVALYAGQVVVVDSRLVYDMASHLQPA
jgi:hypothetical protein